MEIRLEHISKFYEKSVLNDICLSIKGAHAVGIIGQSGCGKSTLLRLLAGMEKPETGQLIVNGTNLNTADKKAYQRNIGYVFQKHNLFPHLSLKDNIVLILHKIKKYSREEAEKKAIETLKMVHLEDEMNKKPDTVSGGQAQRASIARALAADPQLIFLDEPTAALDPILTAEVLKVIQELKNQGREFIFVTHELKFLKNFADHILFLDHGKIAEEGSIDCLTNPKTKLLENFVRGEL